MQKNYNFLVEKMQMIYSNNKKRGELDFLIEEDAVAIPVEVKSGKDYRRHSALNNMISDFGIKKALVLTNDNLSVSNETIYLPIYMIMFIVKENKIKDETYIPDISALI